MSVTQATMLGSGAVAGGVSVTVFTLLHQVLIVSIWWMFPIMLVAGAVCGMCLAWCYAALVRTPSVASWAAYVGMFTAMFGLLAATSLALYEPVITLDELLTSSGGNPIPIGEALLLMAVFTVAWAGVLTTLFRGGGRGFARAVVTTAVLMLLLGSTVSTAGLVEVPTAAWRLVVEFFGYLVVLGGTDGLVQPVLWRRSQSPPWSSTESPTLGPGVVRVGSGSDARERRVGDRDRGSSEAPSR